MSEGLELQAYHDGELRGLARWRFERRLRRSPELRRELAALARLAQLVRDEAPRAPVPDLWDRIALRLPAEDARRAEAAAGKGAAAWWRPLGALAAGAAALAALYFGLAPAPLPPGGTVRWVDRGGPALLVVDDAEADVTIIWLLEDAVGDAARGGSREVV
jgi:anti-sigma-K factor RskA